jgi:ANTAR domain
MAIEQQRALGDGFWQERAEQLQRALDSRIVIEQAKGILGERFGLGIEGGFGLLRQAARRHRTKLQALARAVVDNNDTPAPIVEMLALNVDTFIAVPRDERVVRTEELYKRLNESIATLLKDGSPTFLCECGNPLCNETIELDREDLEVLHAEQGRYAIMTGHEIPDLETVVHENEHYAVVAKRDLAVTTI